MINSPAQILDKTKNILAVYYKVYRKNLRATPGSCYNHDKKYCKAVNL